ncbi:hypothetical protein PPH41_42830, partial [Burkholderia gladioli]|nr:hypothetical protein [Burkholderia gladioli]
MLAGVGIAHGPRWLFEASLADGRLQLLLDAASFFLIQALLLVFANPASVVLNTSINAHVGA